MTNAELTPYVTPHKGNNYGRNWSMTISTHLKNGVIPPKVQSGLRRERQSVEEPLSKEGMQTRCKLQSPNNSLSFSLGLPRRNQDRSFSTKRTSNFSAAASLQNRERSALYCLIPRESRVLSSFLPSHLFADRSHFHSERASERATSPRGN